MRTFRCLSCRTVYKAEGTLYLCECGEPLRVSEPKSSSIGSRPGEVDASESPPKKTVQAVGLGESLANGLFVGVLIFGVGFLLLFCFWPVGVLFMLAGLVTPLASLTDDWLRGPCPYCGHEVRVSAVQPGVNCSACKKRIVVRDRDFVRID